MQSRWLVNRLEETSGEGGSEGSKASGGLKWRPQACRMLPRRAQHSSSTDLAERPLLATAQAGNAVCLPLTVGRLNPARGWHVTTSSSQ